MMRLVVAILAAASVSVAADLKFFETKVRPLLATKCHSCHTATEMGGLRLDSRERIMQGGSRGPAVVAGDAGESLLIKAVRRVDEHLKMPPSEALSTDDIAVLEEWIAAGVQWPEVTVAEAPAAKLSPEARNFWSFQPVHRPAVPNNTSANPIDRFVTARLDDAGLEPAPAAEKRTLIRRVTFTLLGLPPTPEETSAFLADESDQAYAKLVDRLLDSPHYGERMARHWLDLARYADGQSAAYADTPLPNAWRYRDWVVEAFNTDLPYDEFVVSQLAADLLEEPKLGDHLPALGFHSLRDKDDDRVDVTGRALLGLTIGCAQCHDHKFDPIPQSDFYALQGIFSSTNAYNHPLAPADQVADYNQAKKRVSDQKARVDIFIEQQRDQLIDVMMERTADYLVAYFRVTKESLELSRAAEPSDLDLQTLDRWLAYLRSGPREHPYLSDWDTLIAAGGSLEEAREKAEEFEAVLVSIHREKRAIEDRNYVKLGGADGVKNQRTLLNTNLEFLEPLKYYVWRDMSAPPAKKRGLPFVGGVYYHGPKEIDRFLSGVWKEHLARERAELKRLEEALPAQYPFLHAYRDAKEPKDARIAIRGDKKNLGDVAPRRFLSVLNGDERKRFDEGSGRLQLARAIASPDNPLTARVFVNRLWQWRFNRGLVASPSNFGQLGERPTHPELLDWLAAEFMESGWSIKSLDRKILLSKAYRRSSKILEANHQMDADNKLLWRFNPVERLDAETIRDAILSISGNLDFETGGPPIELNSVNVRRALYGVVDRTNPDPAVTLFDFPDAKAHSDARDVTVGPLQRLFFLNNPFIIEQSQALADRLADEAGSDTEARVRRAYDLIYCRPPEPGEIAAASTFLKTDTWERYAQVLLGSSEFLTVR